MCCARPSPGITALIERHIGTCVTKTVTGEWVPGDVRTSIRLAEAPVLSVASVASVYPQGPAWTTADLIVNPAAGTVRLASLLPMWFGPWKATYTAGRAEIPPDVIEGAKAALYRPVGAAARRVRGPAGADARRSVHI